MLLDKAVSRQESAIASASGRVLPAERLTEFLLGRKELDNPEQTLRLEDISWDYTYSITFLRGGTFTCTGWYGSKGYWSVEDGKLTLVFDNTKESRCVMVFLTAGFSGNSLKRTHLGFGRIRRDENQARAGEMRTFAIITLLAGSSIAALAQAPEITMPMKVIPTPTPAPTPTPPPRPTPPPPPEQRKFSDLDGAQTMFDKAESQAAIPGLTKYIRDLEALKKQFMLRDTLQDAQAVDMEIAVAKRELKNAQDVVAGTRKPIADKMTQFLWGTDDANKIPQDRLVAFHNFQTHGRKKILFNKDGSLLRTDNIEGTWWIENGNLVLVLAMDSGLEKLVFPAAELSKGAAQGRFVDGPSLGHKVELLQSL